MAIFSSSTKSIPAIASVPRHIAVIMDGNGRWARKRFLPRIAGHKRGVETVRDMVKLSISRGIEYLTLFAFSSENWRRPPEEVSFLMELFMEALKREVSKLHENNICLKMIGDRSRFDASLCAQIEQAEALTQKNTALTLTIAANYGGRWDMMQAINKMLQAHPAPSGQFDEESVTPTFPCIMHQSRICLFALGENNALVIFYCGSLLTVSFISPTRFGQTLMRLHLTLLLNPIKNVSVVLGEPVNN